MSGEEELGLIESAAYRYARRHGVNPEKAERLSERVAIICKDAVDFATDMQRIVDKHGG